MLKQKRLNLTQSPDVNYVGEDGIDADGLKREFLTSLMSSIRDGEGPIALFEGEFPHLVPVHSTDAIASNLFFCIGQLIAYSVVHGGIGFTGLSPAAKSFLVHESIDTACEFLEMKDIADLALREMLEAVGISTVSYVGQISIAFLFQKLLINVMTFFYFSCTK